MSKRFGRNQKRAMRATILEQSVELRRAGKHIDAIKSAQRPMRESLDEVARVLGNNFIGLPAVTQVVDSIRENYPVTAETPVANFLPLASNSDMAMMVTSAIYELESHSVVADLCSQVHLRLKVAGRTECSYAIDPEDVCRIGWERLAQEYTPLIAEAFARMLCDQKRYRP